MTVEQMRKETAIPVVITDHRGIIIHVNKPFEALFGWTAREILGKTVTKIIPSQLHDAHNLGFSRFVTTGKPTLLGKPLKLRAIGKSGHEFDAEHFLAAEKQQGQWIFGATIRPADSMAEDE